MSNAQQTLAILKPHIVKNPFSLNQVKNIILKSNFEIVCLKRKIISIKEAESFYSEHKGQFFYNRLVSFMTSGPSELMVLARENAIQEWRLLMGPTKVFRAQFENPCSLRGQFGLSDTRNATHGSDSPESAVKEIQLFFPEFS
ncbi:unnamed protein product [Acanthoscelides obtectus]|uniref:Nucleoside diphosphate kinase n=1 Tax=Acanthoscelides obtectus TaxID=200917 RepID=A0A9P0LPV1_ACAOB|nr:unnamed protein product [Acanthoscelides obtectus]CAK1628330.1 Nucleoside diphosphate kinase 6 [Acanthoscelides obtectus]